MKVMWIANFRPVLANDDPEARLQTGGWIDGALCDYDGRDYELSVAFPSETRKKWSSACGVTFYEVSGVRVLRGERDKSSVRQWRSAIEDFCPDVVLIWGTEFVTGRDVLDAINGKCPVLFYIQGVSRAIAEKKYGGLSLREIALSDFPLGILRVLKLKRDCVRISKQAKFEEEMIRRCDGIISDNDWCFANFSSIKKDLSMYVHPLPLKQDFLQSEWSIDKCDDNRLFTVAGNGPLKGLHVLIEALSIVKKEFGDVQLVIPGEMKARYPAVIYRNPYHSYLRKLIQKYGLEANVSFPGLLTSEEMAKNMISARVFVMPSIIENHSSTLREAMYIGVPCVSSVAGSSSEAIESGNSGFLYMHDEPRVLAYYITKLLRDDDLAVKMGIAARKSAQEQFSQEGSGARLASIFLCAVTDFGKGKGGRGHESLAHDEAGDRALEESWA